MFPNYPIHTLDNMYKANLKKDVEEDEHCNEHSNPHQSISGGIITVTCGHKITKGFRLIER